MILNQEQEAIVRHMGGPARVVAGAGSGKTQTLVERIIYLIDEKDVDPDRILLLTFANKAARDMTNRVNSRLPGDVQIWSGTFHAVGNRILRHFGPAIGLAKNYSIITPPEAAMLLKEASEIVGHKLTAEQSNNLLEAYNWGINTQTDIDDALRSRSFNSPTHITRKIKREILLEYQTKKLEYAVLDFTDLLFHWMRLLNLPEFADLLSNRFDFLLVDEYQDTTLLQGLIADKMTNKSGHLMVVGDDRQSIYGFRGVSSYALDLFLNRHPDATTYFLELNYRSTPAIVNLAQKVISNNKTDISRKLTSVLSDFENGEPILVIIDNPKIEAEFVLQQITNFVEEGISLNDICIMYRASYQVENLEAFLSDYDIPYEKRGGSKLFETKHVQDLFSFLRLILNPKDRPAFLRSMKQFEGIGHGRAEKLFKHIVDSDHPLEELSSEATKSILPKSCHAIWHEIVHLIEKLIVINDRKNSVVEVIKVLRDKHLNKYIEKSHPSDYKSRLFDLDLVEERAKGYFDIQAFAASVTLEPNDLEKTIPSFSQKLSLTTIHQAKGLEWDIVFIIGLSEGGFPRKDVVLNEEALEEERRVFHVAITRAKTKLFMTYPKLREFSDGHFEPCDLSSLLRENASSDGFSSHLWDSWSIYT